MSTIALVVATLMLCAIRLDVPTVGHSWPAVFTATAHIFVGVLMTLIWLRRGRWALGWACLAAPTILEGFMFVAANYR